MRDEVHHKLQAAFCPLRLDVVDDSHKHAGHKEAKQHGGSHFAVTIVAEAFRGQTRVARHRMVYAALEGLFAPGGIHALQITALSPDEVA